MKNILAALFATCCLSTTALLAGSPEKGQSFKKDIEYLFDLIEHTALTVDMRHQIYGLDFGKIKREMLPLADSVKNSAECAVLAHRILSRFNDPLMNVFYPEKTYWIDQKAEIAAAKERFSKDFAYEMAYVRQKETGFEGFWKDGDFYLSEARMTSPTSGERPKTHFPTGARVLSVDGHGMTPYEDGFTELRSTDIRYSASGRQAYAHSITPQQSIVAVQNGDTATALRPFKCEVVASTGAESLRPAVLYFNETNSFTDNTLYLRVPEMNPAHLPFFKKELAKYRHHRARKLIIDVRGNRSGCNAFWHELLSLLLSEPLEFTECLAVKKSDISTRFLASPGKQGILADNYQVADTTLASLPGVPLYRLSRQVRITSHPKGIRHIRKIAVIFDENCGAAALNMLYQMNRFPDRFITVGNPAHPVGGAGEAEFEFVLPFSKTAIRIPACVTLDRISPAEDSDLSPMLTVEPSIEDLLLQEKYVDKGEQRYSREYLKYRDKFFNTAREALE